MAEITPRTKKREKRTRTPSFPLPKRGFTAEESAHYCGVPVKTIYEAKRPKADPEARGRFPVPGVKRGKTWLFERQDLDNFLNQVFSEKDKGSE